MFIWFTARFVGVDISYQQTGAHSVHRISAASLLDHCVWGTGNRYGSRNDGNGMTRRFPGSLAKAGAMV
ncbi:hypothetical protein [Nitrosomonas halophila]|uniref:hypothetical protein n=1 Tax=Nitrosomonas halophila TaxID=44576 RepID=UPI0015A2822E|nr:hypothetical protein [Nitrosomonas halophila]